MNDLEINTKLIDKIKELIKSQGNSVYLIHDDNKFTLQINSDEKLVTDFVGYNMVIGPNESLESIFKLYNMTKESISKREEIRKKALEIINGD